MKAYEFSHVIGFEETNLVGNVYFLNYLRWQGRVREMFLHEYAPDVLEEFHQGLALITLRCSCEYLQELEAFDKVLIRMWLGGITPNRFSMRFEYWRTGRGAEELVARGEQQVACMRRENGKMIASAVPPTLRQALEAYE
jgi:enediyne biosynthesis thioesterase